MQGLADGYFVIPYTIGGYLTGETPGSVTADHPAFTDVVQTAEERTRKLLSVKGKRTVDDFHRQLGLVMWDHCGMSRTNEGLASARETVRALRDEFWENVLVPGDSRDFNQSLERACRVADFMEFAELMIVDALHRQESCGGHFNEAYQTEEGEAKRDDDHFTYVAAWEFTGVGKDPQLHKEELTFENVQLTQRSYK
jgi:succinate dehydrogenase / fumarate reductase flavoprotein subunit